MIINNSPAAKKENIRKVLVLMVRTHTYNVYAYIKGGWSASLSTIGDEIELLTKLKQRRVLISIRIG
jgi:hypothetical protein